MIAWLFLNRKLVAILAGAALVAASYYATYRYGRSIEEAEWQTKTLQKSVEVLRQRRDLNVETQTLSDRDLCLALGGRVPDDKPDECL